VPLAEEFMSLSTQLKNELSASAMQYAADVDISVTARKSAVIFRSLADSFCPASYKAIQRNEDWNLRTQKKHTQVSDTCEMQSSNSSDALLMSVFCHPKIATWKGVQDVLGFVPNQPVFGLMARVPKRGTDGDDTEIDLAFGECFAEAKLTEVGFTDKPKTEVEKYKAFSNVFHAASLAQNDENYHNYQVIRNVLAAVHHSKDHFLFCDQRRPDLVRSYLATVACIRENSVRQRCRVLFWQEIAQNVGKSLQMFLKTKYAIC